MDRHIEEHGSLSYSTTFEGGDALDRVCRLEADMRGNVLEREPGISTDISHYITSSPSIVKIYLFSL